MIRSLVHAAVLAAAAAAAASASPAPLKVKEAEKGLLAKAKITAEDALKTAQAKVAGETLKEAEIENEDGKLVFSFEFVKKGAKGIDEVNVDALTDDVVSVEHEGK